MNKTVFLFGDLPLATQVLNLFYRRPDVDIVGVFCQKPDKEFTKDPFDDKRSLNKAAKELGIPVYLSLESVLNDFSGIGLDIGISCRASIIYDTRTISLFRDYFINMHGGLLPARRGVNIACHSIIEGDSYSGGTLHIIEKEIDVGGIIDRKKFKIKNIDTAFSVYQKTQWVLLSLIDDNLESIVNNQLKIVPQSKFIEKGEKSEYFNSNAIKKCKRIELDKMKDENIDRIIRGCDFPGHEPAFFFLNGKKIYLTTRTYFSDE